MRAFVAIEVDDPSTSPIDTSGTRPPAHLTLRFFADVDARSVPTLVAAVREATVRVPVFDLTLEGVGAFPSRDAPRVVWVGVTEGRSSVRQLADAISDALSRAGVPPERSEFVPHVTLFRVRSGRDRERARRLLEGSEAAPATRVVHVAQVLLKESTLTREGPLHRTLERFPLAEAAAERP